MSTIQRNPMTTGLKMLILLVLLSSVFAAFLFALSSGAAASVATDAVSIDDPDLDHIETDVSLNGTETVYVNVTDINDNVVSSQTVSGAAGDTFTVKTYVASAGDYSVIVEEANETTTDGIQVESTSTSVVSYNLLKEQTYNISDPANESLAVDVEFNGTADAVIEIRNNDTDTVLENTTISGTDGDVLTRTFDIPNEANYTATVTSLNASTQFGDVFVSVDDSATSETSVVGAIFGSEDSPTVAIFALIIGLVILGYTYGDEIYE